MKRRILNVLIAVDQLLYVLITLGNGSPDETMSAAAWRLELQGRLAGRVFRPVIDWLFRPIEANHCRLSYEAEAHGAHLPCAYGRNTGDAQ